MAVVSNSPASLTVGEPTAHCHPLILVSHFNTTGVILSKSTNFVGLNPLFQLVFQDFELHVSVHGGVQLRCLPLFPLHPATLPVSFPATGLCGLLMGVGQREGSKKQRPVLPTLYPLCLLVAKC